MDVSELEAPITVAERRVYCDGGGALGHPGVYLTIDETNRIVCPYCSRTFVLDLNARTGADH